MKNLIVWVCIVFCCFGVMDLSAVGLNEWSFNRDAAGLTLSQATNSGTQSAVFSAGGAGFLETDGIGNLVCTRAATGANEMWTDGAVLDADVTQIVSGVHYLRYDCSYDLSETDPESGTAFGLGVIDESGTRVTGLFLGKGDTNAPPGTAIKQRFSVPSAGKLSTVLKLDMEAGTMTAWYSVAEEPSFEESRPAESDVPIQLTSIDKLRFQATGDFQPAGTDNYAAMDHIRTAATWDEITSPASLALTGCPLFHDHMVLQRDMDVSVWGRVTPASVVTIQLDGTVVATAVADGNGDWIAEIEAQAHDNGTAHVLTVESGIESLQFTDVVFGDVYLVSGQSNMNMTMNWLPLYWDEYAVADSFPLIRHVVVSNVTSTTVLDDPPLAADWAQCSQESLAAFSAAGYYFAKNLYQETGVPIGLLFSAWGGKSIEQFTSPSGMEAVPELAGMLQNQEQGGVPLLYEIYNAKIAPLMPYGIKGAIWYQGENNGNDGNIYKYKMQALARGWRKNWGLGDFPLYYVQLANYNTTVDWPGLRNAQFAALPETNFGMTVTIDIGDHDDIHPRNKYDVGLRLAKWALAKNYGQNIVYSGPLYQSSRIEDSQIRVMFDYADSGLFTGRKTGTDFPAEVTDPLQNFEVAGADKVFVEADAVIDRDTVLVSAVTVSDPMYVRYCWASWPSGANLLYNAAGLPASPFNSAESYILSVVSGAGTASGLTPGSVQSISASAPASGKVFDRWIGAASEITNPNASSTTVTMPEHSLYLLATYRDTSEPAYTLTVNSGDGSGTSQAGSVLNIEALSIAGQEFDHWAGDTQSVVNVYAPDTTLRMPSNNVAVTAVYHAMDSVGDGISDEWRAAFFGGEGSTTNSLSAADADPDGDGMTNLKEFYAGTSPANPLSNLLLNGDFTGANPQLLFQTVDGLRYQLQKTDALDSASWDVVYFNVIGNAKQKTLPVDIADNPVGFYRVCLKEE